MKVVKFRIKNYKSIKDSGYCYLEDKITILAGKNESGKTAILEALEDFNVNKTIRKEAIPLEDKTLVPQISVTLKLDRDDIGKIKGIPKEVMFSIDKDSEIEIIKKYPDSYRFSHETEYRIAPKLKEIEQEITVLTTSILTKLKHYNLNIDGKKAEEIIKSLQSKEFLKRLPLKIREEILRYVTVLHNRQSEKKNYEDKLAHVAKSFLSLLGPNFILFKSFDDILPRQVSISEASKLPIVQDLSSITNLDFNLIQPQGDPRVKEKHKNEVNLQFKNEYKQFWSQDNAELYISWDSSYIYFWIKENDELYYFDIRSKGKQWYLSYDIRVTARSMEGKRNVILIDEPGLFLHAKAQRDVLKKLEDCAKNGQIIYTTHSPYLIPAEKLYRVRLVIKDIKEGTKIEKLTAKADIDTLTPILTAIGEDLACGVRVNVRNSVVVEGFSDYLWLLCFKKLLNIETDINIIPAVGADNIFYIGAILLGWGLDPIFLMDNDKKGKKIKQKLMKDLGVPAEKIVLVPPDSTGRIEDMFSREDKEKFNIITEKGNRKSKVLQAKEFLDKIERGEIKQQDISGETKRNFSSLFDIIKELQK